MDLHISDGMPFDEIMNDEVFDLDSDSLACIRLKSKTSSMLLNEQRERVMHNRIASLQRKNLLHVFCMLCIKINIDPLNIYSMHLVFLLFSKIPMSRRKEAFEDFCAMCGLTVNVDWERYDAMNQNHDCKQELITSETEWLGLLNIVHWQVDTDLELEFKADRNMSKLFSAVKACQELHVMRLGMCDFAQIMSAVHINDTNSAVMLERTIMHLCNRQNLHGIDNLEMNCLKIISALNNDALDESCTKNTLMMTCRAIFIPENIRSEIRTVLQEYAQSRQVDMDFRMPSRKSLRVLAQSLQSQRFETSSSFNAWAQQMQFSINTSMSRQKLLYFLRSQQPQFCDVRQDFIAMYCSASEAKKVVESKLDILDLTCITECIKSLRVYENNIKSLLEFRSEVLVGLNYSLRSTLSLAEVLQLYVTCYQHKSLTQSIWKSIVPIWNHTLHCLCAKFAEKHKFEFEAVAESLHASLCGTANEPKTQNQSNQKHNIHSIQIKENSGIDDSE